jgi:hypothetical protein
MICLLLWLSGCASRVWCGATPATANQVAQAQRECKGDGLSGQSDVTVNSDPHAVRGVSGGEIATSVGQDPYVFKACMEKRGYLFVERPQCHTLASTP